MRPGAPPLARRHRLALAATLITLFVLAMPAAAHADASLQLSVAAPSAPLHLDVPESYTLRMESPSDAGVPVTSVGPVTATLPPGTVFTGATPAADCQPGCDNTTPATITWTSPCATPIAPGGACPITMHVAFPSGTFPTGTSVTTSFTARATYQGHGSASYGPASDTQPVTTFVPSPAATLAVSDAGTTGTPILGETFSFGHAIANTGNVPLDDMTMTASPPAAMSIASVTTGAYTNLDDVAPGTGVRVSYRKDGGATLYPWGESSSTGVNTTLTSPPPGLGAGEHVTQVVWSFGQMQPGAAAVSAATRPSINGVLATPDRNGSAVAYGSTIQSCATVTGTYTAGPSPISQSACDTFTLLRRPSVTPAAASGTTELGSAASLVATLGAATSPIGSLDFTVFTAADTACDTAVFSQTIGVHGVGPYSSLDFITPTVPGDYVWRVAYSGDDLNRVASSACGASDAAFTVVGPGSVAVAFGSPLVGVGDTVPITYTLSNNADNTVALTGVGLADALPTGLVVATPNGVVNTCGGSVDAITGGTSIELSGGTIAAGDTCTVTADLTTVASGPIENTTGSITSGNGGDGNDDIASVTAHADTATAVDCDPAVAYGVAATCAVTVTDTSTAPVPPSGAVDLASDKDGTFSDSTCTLGAPTSDAATCEVTYTPTGEFALGASRYDAITATYTPGDDNHFASTTVHGETIVVFRAAGPAPPTTTTTTTPPPPVVTPPTIAPSAASRTCASRRDFVVHLRYRVPGRPTLGKGHVTRATLTGPAGGKLRTPRFTATTVTVDLRGEPRGTYTVKLSVRTPGEKTTRTLTLRYATCEP